MKRNLLIAIFAIIALYACEQSGISTNAKIATEADSVAYIVGTDIGGNMAMTFPNIDPNILAKAIVDSYNGEADTLFPDQTQMQMFVRNYMTKAQEAATMEAAKPNIEKGEAFLAENGKKDGVITTESGMQYEVMSEGTGEKPTAENTVKVHYHGTNLDGEVFDSSVDKGEPIEFPLNGVIKGWTEGVQYMNVGSKYKFYIPASLAYGNQQKGPQIPAGSLLVFEVELLAIVK